MDKTSFPLLAVDSLRTTKLFCWFPSPTLAEGSTIARWDRIFACLTLNDPSIGAPGGSHVHRCEQPPPVVFSTAFLAGFANTPCCLAPFWWEVTPPWAWVNCQNLTCLYMLASLEKNLSLFSWIHFPFLSTGKGALGWFQSFIRPTHNPKSL